MAPKRQLTRADIEDTRTDDVLRMTLGKMWHHDIKCAYASLDAVGKAGLPKNELGLENLEVQ